VSRDIIRNVGGKITALAALTALGACGLAGLNETPSNGPTAGGSVGGDVGGNVETFSGEVNRFDYDAATDTLSINNLPFDLSGTYTRDPTMDVTGFKAYRNSGGGRNYLAFYAESPGATVGAGAVKTANYNEFGYGGTVLRATRANLPTTGEAQFSGRYAGVRITNPTSGQFNTVDGSASVLVDFRNFDGTGAIDISVSNRNLYDNTGALVGSLPNLAASTTSFQTGSNVLNQTAISEIVAPGTPHLSGTLNGAVGGTVGAGLGGAIAGVIVISGPTSVTGVTAEETGAFVATQSAYTP